MADDFTPDFFVPGATPANAFLWERGVMRDLDTLGAGTDRIAFNINEREQVF
jgi:hypothetical protein